MQRVGKLELVFTSGPRPALERSVFSPSTGTVPVKVLFGECAGLRWGNAAISLAWCLVAYHRWGQTHSAGLLPWLEPKGRLREWHLEDNLDRAVFLRRLKREGRSSPLGGMATAIRSLLKMKGGLGAAVIVAPLLQEPHVSRALARAAKLVFFHLPRHPRSSLLRVAALWIIGRRAEPGEGPD
jgi:hypothetical protein